MSGRRASHPRPVPIVDESAALPPDALVDEEAFSWYEADKWYPIRKGETIQNKYQVLLKLGYGSVSTVWLCRDLIQHKYMTLKVYETGHRQACNEYRVLQHIASIESSHLGAKFVRHALDEFELAGQRGPHKCLVYQPLGLTLGEIRHIAGGQIPGDILKSLAYGMLLALDFLHTEAMVVHTDLQEGNIMISIEDEAFFYEVVEDEWASPSAVKIDKGRIVYTTTSMDIPDDPGSPVIADFGDAQFGEDEYTVEVMPDLYRAPEIILGIAWDEKIDIWAFGLMVSLLVCLLEAANDKLKIWDLFEGKHLFNRRLPSRQASCKPHLARTIELLGPPPPDLLTTGAMTKHFFDEKGKMKTQGGSLEEEEENLEGDEKAEFLAFLRKMLQWRPEDRKSARELLNDPWLRVDT
ncbi:putative serine/threonine protein kinase [Plectosphaerella plurivora]|uniref:non-specific serine/threonine protein kinase n=1 Tax=Plectosphaerella plurivora TaxID=936078 RepID=A0A9P8V194_9PEZI|nr:putative serine/threonine protein kinase [Plectosphaerella plurivora]